MNQQTKDKLDKLRDDLSKSEIIFEPKYGGKDHSGYDTLMKYEINGYLQESFERGFDALSPIVLELVEEVLNS